MEKSLNYLQVKKRTKGIGLTSNLKKIKDFSKEDIIKNLDNEVFTEVFAVKKEKIYVSDKWFNIDSQFVPKKFIKCGYVTMYGYDYSINLILVNGKYIVYKVGPIPEDLEKALNIIGDNLKKFNLIHSDYADKRMEYFNKYKELKAKGRELESLI